MTGKKYDWNSGEFVIGEKVRHRRILDALRNLVADHPLGFTIVTLCGGIALLRFVVDGLLTREFFDLLTKWER